MIFAPMFWNLCKSSWRKGLYFLLFGVVFLLLVQDSWSSSIRSCGTVFEGHSLQAGKEAGSFKKLNGTQSLDQCIIDCCNDEECTTALFVGHLRACYTVDCETVEACRPVPASKASKKKYNLNIFKKTTKGPHDIKTSPTQISTIDDPNIDKPLIREKRHKSCHHYHGTQSGCKEYLNNKLLYFNRAPSLVEKSVALPLKWLRLKLSQDCQKYALAAVCHYAFPYCSDRFQPSPIFLCQEDCEQLSAGVCKSEFKMANDAGHGGFLPDCSTLPSSRHTKCTKLNIPESLQVLPGKVSPTATPAGSQSPLGNSNNKTNNEGTSDSNDDDEDLNLFKQQINQQTGTKPSLKANELSSNEQNVEYTDETDETDEPKNDHSVSSEEKLADSETDANVLPSNPPTSHGTSRKAASSVESNEDEDLNTPKRSKIPENNNDNEDLKRDDAKGSSKSTPAISPSKPLGLGLKTSLGLLEPTKSTERTEEKVAKASPTAATPTGRVEKPTFVKVTDSDDDTNLEVTVKPTVKGRSATPPNKVTPTQPLDNSTVSSPSTSPTKAVTGGNKSDANTTTTKGPTEAATTKPSPSEAPPTLQVSAGHNKVLTLPANSIELYASAYPKETPANPYTYHWQQISAPQDSHGYMEGKDTRRVILTKLSHVGVYQFKVTVKGTVNGAFGYAHVNVTVRPVPRVNKPPRADISPKEQSITLPTNEVVLDGSKSSDDDKITQYKWEEVKGPLNDKNKVISSGVDSPVLQLKSLVPGIYTFKLTVVDSDGETDSTTATVTVNDEKNYPPVARAGNDVVLTMPDNHVILNGNSSTDNKGIVSYEWSKAPSSPAVGDMQGTNTPFLKVSNMVVGDYTLILKVTDTGGLSSTSKVTVVVQPEKNMAPVAKAGSDKDLVFPDDSTTLDAKESHDDQKIENYHWEQESGPSTAEISGADEKVVTVKKLQEGHYVFKLTVTDDKGLSGTDTVAVNVKKDINKAPVSNAGPDVVVHLPNRAAELDGSKSTDDHGIAKYIWHRDPKSPAAGDVINKSDHQAVLRLSNLVEGMYKFKLTVFDAKGLESSDEALLTVKEDENSAHLVELYLDVDITRFTEENKGQLIRKLAVILDVQDNDIVVEHLKEAGTGHSMMVMFYVKGLSVAKDGQAIAEMLKAKIENEEGFFEFRMLKVEPYICRNNCSFHGYCDRRTKLCVCESFWMQDIFKSSFGVKESNCDWSILYVTVIIFGIVMGIGGIIWAVCFCLGRISRRRRRRLDEKVVPVEPPLMSDSATAESSGRRRGRSRRRHRYAIIDEDDDDDKAESMEMLPKHKYSSLTLTDSDEDSDETTLFEAKKRIPNGSVNGTVGRKAL